MRAGMSGSRVSNTRIAKEISGGRRADISRHPNTSSRMLATASAMTKTTICSEQKLIISELPLTHASVGAPRSAVDNSPTK